MPTGAESGLTCSQSGGSFVVERTYAMYVELSFICGSKYKADRNCSCDSVNLWIPAYYDSITVLL